MTGCCASTARLDLLSSPLITRRAAPDRRSRGRRRLGARRRADRVESHCLSALDSRAGRAAAGRRCWRAFSGCPRWPKPTPCSGCARPRTISYLLTLGGLFTPLRQIDPGALIPTPQFTLGLALPAFALLSLPIDLRRRAGFHALFLLLGLALIVLALTVFPSEVWLLGVITLCLCDRRQRASSRRVKRACLSADPRRPDSGRRAARLARAALDRDAPIDTSPLAQVDYEQQGYGIAGLPDGDALPTTIPPTHRANRALIASYRDGRSTNSDRMPTRRSACWNTIHMATAFKSRPSRR